MARCTSYLLPLAHTRDGPAALVRAVSAARGGGRGRPPSALSALAAGGGIRPQPPVPGGRIRAAGAGSVRGYRLPAGTLAVPSPRSPVGRDGPGDRGSAVGASAVLARGGAGGSYVTVRRLERSPPLDHPVRRSEAGPGWWLGTRAAGLVLLALLVPVHRLWAVQLLLIPLLLVLPGEILLRALRVPGRAIASFPAYVPCASLAVLIGSGLAVDLVGPVAGVAAPLRTVPLLAGLEAACAVLLAASIRAAPATAIPWQSLRVPVASLLPLVLPLLAAAGALRLNAGYGAGVALTAVWACLLVFIAVLAYAQSLEPVLLATVIYAIALAMLWSFSLRGNLVYGYDISDEYYVFHHTVTAGVWHLGHPGDAYGAMLSTTVLPTALHAVAGVPEQAVFTVVYP